MDAVRFPSQVPPKCFHSAQYENELERKHERENNREREGVESRRLLRQLLLLKHAHSLRCRQILQRREREGDSNKARGCIYHNIDALFSFAFEFSFLFFIFSRFHDKRVVK